ncbi:hypothetical protein [Paenibacillus naphthalenovorans]|uniref:hypothetical protein n=1 Tax=Paenibacillus naphthalenovorans TaxID=162209 RepID=UPI003D2719F7
MDRRYEQLEVTYAHMALINVGDGRIAAGVQLSQRQAVEGGRALHVPYRVLSLLYADLKTPNIRQSIPVTAVDTLQHVSHDTKLVIFAGNTPHFIQRRRLESDVGMYATLRGIDVKFQHKPGIERVIPDLMLLANDAIRRGGSCICAV